MSEEFGTGVITKLTDGRWDNQYEVEITLMDGSKLAGFDGISVYEKKKDGDPSKVWPLVQESKFQGKPFTWQGNIKNTDTQGGPKRYATITWANAVDSNEWTQPSQGGGENGSGWGQSEEDSSSVQESPVASRVWGSAQGSADPSATPPSNTPTPSNKDDYWARREAKDEERTREIEAAWAIGVLAPMVGNNTDALHREAHRLIVLKHQIAKELAE